MQLWISTETEAHDAVQWRQQHIRPEKPLPRDVSTAGRHAERRMPYRRTAVDFVLAWLCFGIPYFFANRHGYQRFDEESGLRTVGPMLVIGASACLVVSSIILPHPSIMLI